MAWLMLFRLRCLSFWPPVCVSQKQCGDSARASSIRTRGLYPVLDVSMALSVTGTLETC